MCHDERQVPGYRNIQDNEDTFAGERRWQREKDIRLRSGSPNAGECSHQTSRIAETMLCLDRLNALVGVLSSMGFLILRSIFESFDVGIFRKVAIIMTFYLCKLL